MPKKAKEMTAIAVKKITKPGRHAVGVVPGLLLVVKESGAKSWIFRTIVGNKRRNIGLGGYPEVPLAQAYEKARYNKRLIEQGIDPVEERQAKRRALISASMTKMIFAEAAQHYHKIKSVELKSEKAKKEWISSVNRFAVPIIGNMPVDEIEITHILKVLEPIWNEKNETATRLRQRLEHIFAWAIVSGYRKSENPARWRGRLEKILAKPSKVHRVKHFEALPWQEISAFMMELRKRNGMAARCLEFIILTACRSGEARLAVWDEIDIDNKVWTIPADRMKAGQEHAVPLPADAIKLLKALPRFEGAAFVFPAPRGGSLSDMAISMLCRRMKIAAVPHGFRSTFRDWCAENTNFPREVAEMALAHAIDNKTEAAYRRGDLFEKRRRLMEAWNGYCNRVQTDTTAVTPIRKVM